MELDHSKVGFAKLAWGSLYARKKFVVVGTDGTILTSPDGTNWSPKL
jgi:hypothetical protein